MWTCGLAEDAGDAGRGPGQAEQGADGGGLAGAVRAEEAEDLAGGNVEGHRVDGGSPAVSLRQSEYFNGGRVWLVGCLYAKR